MVVKPQSFLWDRVAYWLWIFLITGLMYTVQLPPVDVYIIMEGRLVHGPDQEYHF